MRFTQTVHASVKSRAAKAAICVLAGLLAATTAANTPSAQAGPSQAPAPAEAALQRCAPSASLEGRLVMEQWTRDGDCAEPVRTRVTDRFLGIACLEEGPDVTICRAFVPPPGSRAFNTTRVFRCVDIALADTEQGTVISRMREWAAPTRACDWALAGEVLAMEVDFARGYVCVGGLCMPVAKLSTLGKLRLRELIETALREFGLLASTASVRAR